MEGLNGCYNWEATFSPQVKCATADSQTTCSDATWFWLLAAGLAVVAVLKKK